MFEKQCSVCKVEKPSSAFARNPLAPDGCTAVCKACGGADIIDYLTLCIETPTRRFSLSAAAIVNYDIGVFKYYMGRLGEMNALYPFVLREMIKLLTDALEDIEGE